MGHQVYNRTLEKALACIGSFTWSNFKPKDMDIKELNEEIERVLRELDITPPPDRNASIGLDRLKQILERWLEITKAIETIHPMYLEAAENARNRHGYR